MKSIHIAREQIFQIISNQMMPNNPPETKLGFERLKTLGYSEIEANKKIGQCVAIEIFNILKYKKPFNRSRYISNLNKLPDEPFDDWVIGRTINIGDVAEVAQALRFK